MLRAGEAVRRRALAASAAKGMEPTAARATAIAVASLAVKVTGGKVKAGSIV